MKEIKVVELFAGVGGFRIGLDKAKSKNYRFNTIWANQWEPASTRQHAANIYRARFGEKGFSCEDIERVIADDFESIPNHDLLVGGFPCQDYSVARTLSQARGLFGQKGVLWWSIYTILKRKGENSPDYLLLENVDRLLKSPAKQRGRDFAVMLSSLSDLGYAVEWRVINAADYGFPQRRRRVFIMGFKKGTPQYKALTQTNDKRQWLTKTGVISSVFKVEPKAYSEDMFRIEGSPKEVSEKFPGKRVTKSPFQNSGVMVDRFVDTAKVVPIYDGRRATLGDKLIVDESLTPPEYYIPKNQLEKWVYLKGPKKEERKTADGHVYHYSEGGMVFPDALDGPSRTIVTGEGGVGPSRFKHVVKTKSGKLRRLMPIELERLDMFPDDWTKLDGVSDNRRAFICGNALVVGVITKLGEALIKSMPE